MSCVLYNMILVDVSHSQEISSFITPSTTCLSASLDIQTSYSLSSTSFLIHAGSIGMIHRLFSHNKLCRFQRLAVQPSAQAQQKFPHRSP